MDKKQLLFVALLAFASSSQPISQDLVYVGTAGSALGAGLLTRYATESTIAGILVGAGSGFFSYLFLSQFTPEGRLARARVKIEHVTRSTFAVKEFTSEDAFFDAVQEVYILSDLHLMAAYADMVRLIELGYEAIALLDAAKEEANYFDLGIMQQYDVLMPRIRCALELLTESVKRIRSNSQYMKQVKVYNERQLAREKLAVQQQIAHAQNQMAQAQMHQAYHR